MNFKVGDNVHFWFRGDAKRSGTIVKETTTKFLIEFWNGGDTSIFVLRRKNEVYDCLIGVNPNKRRR